MSSKQIYTKLLLRRDTTANLQNVVLAQGEPAYSTDDILLKIGDGVSTWAELNPINQPTDNCVTTVKQYSVLSASGSSAPSESAGWIENAYLTGTSATPWIWTRYDYICQNGESIKLYYRVYDDSWKEYEFVGTTTTEEIITQFPCAINGNTLSIGVINDPIGFVETNGVLTYTPSGVIQLKTNNS